MEGRPMSEPKEPWLHGLEPDLQERVLCAMRQCRAKSDQFLAKARALTPTGIAIAVGAAHFDDFIRGEALAKLLRHIGQGLPPSAAIEGAIKECRELIEAHNAKRPSDVNWQRWTESADRLVKSWGEAIGGKNAP